MLRVLGLALTMTLLPTVAHASSAMELVREARAHEAAHEDDLAVRRYSEALSLDPTYGDAYLGLGALRLRLGDAREAERVYSTALSHAPELRAAIVGRARARRALGMLAAADGDLEVYLGSEGEGSDDVSVLRELAGWYQGEGNALAQLAVWRRLLVVSERRSESRSLQKEARLTVHALELLVGPVDPVRMPPDHSPERRGMARMQARR